MPVKVLSYVACPGVRGCRGSRAAVYLPSHSFTLAMMDFCGTETPLVPREDDGAELEGFVAMLGSARECLDVVGRRRRLSWGEAEKGKRMDRRGCAEDVGEEHACQGKSPFVPDATNSRGRSMCDADSMATWPLCAAGGYPSFSSKRAETLTDSLMHSCLHCANKQRPVRTRQSREHSGGRASVKTRVTASGNVSRERTLFWVQGRCHLPPFWPPCGRRQTGHDATQSSPWPLDEVEDEAEGLNKYLVNIPAPLLSPTQPLFFY